MKYLRNITKFRINVTCLDGGGVTRIIAMGGGVSR